MNLHSCKVAALSATCLEALTRTDEELDLYRESFGLRPNWDILLGGSGFLLSFSGLHDFALDRT